MIDSFAPINPALLDTILPFDSGYPEHIAAGDTRDVLWDVCGSASRVFPDSLWIEPRDWADKARENDRNNTWAINHLDRFTHQGNSHECTCHSLRANFEAARNKALGIIFAEGPKANYWYEESGKHGQVWVSALSVYAEANPRQWGGAGVRQALEIAVRRGMLPETIQPANYTLRHKLHGTTGPSNVTQAGGPWLDLRSFPSGWQGTAKWFKPLEIVFPESFEQAVCLVLHGYAVSVGRSRHAVPWCRYLPGQAMAYPDSYNVIRYDSERTVQSAWRGSFAIISTTLPVDRMKPAGV